MSDGYGYYKVPRKAHLPLNQGGDPLWNEPRVFHRWEAWLDLMYRAAYADHESFETGERIRLRRGEFYASVRFLAARWKWSKSRVQRFLTMLQEMNRIAGQSRDSQRDTYLIVDYEGYPHGRDTREPGSGTVAGQSRDSRGTKYKKEGSTSTDTGPSVLAAEPPPDADDGEKETKTLTPQQQFVEEAWSIFDEVQAERPSAGLLGKWVREELNGNRGWLLDILRELAPTGHLSKGTPYILRVVQARANGKPGPHKGRTSTAKAPWRGDDPALDDPERAKPESDAW